MIRIAQLKLPVGHSEEELRAAIKKSAGGRTPQSFRIVKRSIDARKKPEIYYSYTVDAAFAQEKRILAMKKSRWTRAEEEKYHFPYRCGGKDFLRPVIVGTGPAGLFAGLLLARAGFRPLLLERGERVEQRSETVRAFFQTGILNPESNVQFGEGGAGTFSDGKLNTLVKDRFGRNRFVLREFVRHGAPEEILYEAKPHIGTDILTGVVASLREEILSDGGEIRFGTKLADLCIRDGRLSAIRAETGGVREEIPCETLILAVGHSARDTFVMLRERGVPMCAKSFAVGVRVEHPSAMISESQYGSGYPACLGAASYKLTHQTGSGRGVYTFCMCPGGYVVNASSEPGRLCVNGMSESGRDGKNSNAAVIVTVGPEDFGGDDPLAGVRFQRKYEALAWQCAGGRIPVQLLADFQAGRASVSYGDYESAAKGRTAFANLRDCLPEAVSLSLLEGMEAFGRRIRGYDRPDAILSGVEMRTSSPLRIERGADGQSAVAGLFPCGEGAGYAGGITSAAMDGMRAAEAVGRALGCPFV